MAFNLTFDIVKFSQALTPLGPVTIEWTHTTGTNLQVVLEGSDSRYGQALLRMDVFQGTTLLERVNVDEYINASNRTRDANDRAGVSMRIEDLQIFGITKDPTLALRYQLDGKSRRIQMRLKISDDFQQMVDILSKRGLEFSQQRPNTARPSISSSRPSTVQHDGRPLIIRSIPAIRDEQSLSGPKASPFHIPSMEAGSLSQRAIANASSPTHRADQLTAPTRESLSRPPTAQLWHTQPSQSIQSDGYDVQQGPSAHSNGTLAQGNINLKATPSSAEDFFRFSALGPEIDRGGSKIQPQQGWSSGGLRSDASAASFDLIDTRSLTAHPMTSETSIFPDTLEKEIPPERVLPFKATGNLRPSSAISMPSLSSLIMPDTLEHEIPPPRELPFKVQGSRGGSSRPGSALPQPQSKKAKVSKERPRTASSAQECQSDANACRTNHDGALESMKTIRLPVRGSLPFAASKLAPKDNQGDLEEPVPMKQLIFGNNLRPSVRKRTDSTMDAPHEIESPPNSPERQGPSATPQSAHLDTAAKAVSAEHSVPSAHFGAVLTSKDTLHGLTLDQYTSQTPEARQMALDQFMIGNLQDPSFTTLCEDVERCWRRIALGL